MATKAKTTRARKPRKQSFDQPKPMRVLYKGQCDSLTGKSTLTYLVGEDSKKALQIAIVGNEGNVDGGGGGYWNQCWVAYAEIMQVVKAQKKLNFPSYRLQPLFKGKSINSPSFLMAVLRHEKIVKVSDTNKRMHVLGTPADFENRMQTLSDSTVSMEDPLAYKTTLT